MRNVFAYTEPTPSSGAYPEFISVNEIPGGVEVLVRTRGQQDPARIVLSEAQAQALGVELMCAKAAS